VSAAAGRAAPLLRVMLVDDDSAIRLLERRLLELQGGFEVCAEAADGAMAIDLAERARPGAVILDMYVPEMDGLTALPLLRERLPDSVIVLCTSTQSMTLTSCPDGADAYLEKATTDWSHWLLDVLEDFARESDDKSWPLWERRVGEVAPDYQGPERRGVRR
jgi:two-component system chemotaxis response regulator CheB